MNNFAYRCCQASALLIALGLNNGCRQRSAQQVQAPGYTSATYVHAQGPAAGVPPVTADPAYQDVRIVQQHPQGIPNVPGSMGQESLSTGERVTVVTYVHHYPEPVDTFPSIYWSGRYFYNVHGNFVFWDPFWNSWAYYWGPPHPLIMAWNIQYPWVAFSWGRGFYGPGWYWGGVNPMGFHMLGQVAAAGVQAAPLPPGPSMPQRPKVAPNPNARPRPNLAANAPRPNPSSSPRPNRALVPNPTSRPRANRARVANPNSRPRANRRVATTPAPMRVQGLTRSSRPNQSIPRPSQVVYESRRRATYLQGNVRVNGRHSASRPTQMRVYRPRRPMHSAAPYPQSRPRPNYSRSQARPNYPRSSPRPNYSSAPRTNHVHSPSRSHATSQQRVVGVSRSNPRK